MRHVKKTPAAMLAGTMAAALLATGAQAGERGATYGDAISTADGGQGGAYAIGDAIRALDTLSFEELEAVRGAGGSANPRQRAQTAETQPVGEPDPDSDIQIEALREVGGVLTPRNTFVFEPFFEYEHSKTSRFFFQGIEVADVILVGEIEALDSTRDTITTGAKLRYGITERLEVELRVPYVYRNQESVTQVVGADDPDPARRLTGSNLGDIEATARYQLNQGGPAMPVFISNLRVKSDSGKGPFSVRRDDEGNERELATGSGFWGVEPGLTALFPTDPAVFFAGASYLWHIRESVDKDVGDNRIGRVDPGNVASLNFGMGLAINPRTSVSVGYEHNFVERTETTINDVTQRSDSFQVGSASLGFSYATTDRTSINLSLQVGVTDDAPDVVVGLRLPFAFSL